jgi:hypothetical protein
VQMQQVPEHQPGRSGADDPDLCVLEVHALSIPRRTAAASRL